MTRFSRWPVSLPILVLLASAAGTPAAGTPAAGAQEAIELRTEVGQSLEKALRELKRHGLVVVYSSRLVSSEMRLEAAPRLGAAADVLREVLAPHGLRAFRGPGEAWVVARGGERIDVAGLVYAREGRTPLPGVQVAVLGTGIHTRTGEDGTFRISALDRGTYELEARMPGFLVARSWAIEVNPGRTVEMRFELVSAPVELDEIVVTPSHFGLFKAEPDSGQFLNRDEIRRLPHLAEDVYRAVGWLPGTAHGDISADFHVRGGEEEETLVLLDGLEIYTPFHLRELDVFSTIDSRVVGGVDFLSGGFPVEYGDRMSGVLDISASVSDGRRRQSLGVSFVNAGYLGSGAFAGERGQWLLSARRGYLDLVLDIIDETALDPVYYDLLGQLRYRLGDRNLLSASVHGSYDRVDFLDEDDDEALDLRESAGYFWLTLDTSWSPGLYSRTLLAHGRTRRDRGGLDIDFGFAGIVGGDDRDFEATSFKQDWERDFEERHLLKWGVEAQAMDAEYDFFSRTLVWDRLFTGGEPYVERIVDVEASASGSAMSAYLADRIRLGKTLTAELGVRWDRQTYTLDGDQWSPRLNLAYAVAVPSGHHSRVRAAWGLFHQSQGVHELQVADGVTDFFPAQRAEHRLLSFEHTFPGFAKSALLSGLGLRLELYQKRMSDLRPRWESLFRPNEFLFEVQPDRIRVAPASAEAHGLELVVKQPGRGRIGWWLSYAWARVEDEIAGVKEPRSWDQRHTFTFSLSVERDKWAFNLAGVYHTGWPTTEVFVERTAGDDGMPEFRRVLGPRNQDRLPAYHRLDIRASRKVTRRYGDWTFFVEISNVLDRNNICCREDYVLVFEPGSDEPFLHVEEDDWLPLVPSFGITWEF